MDPRRFGLKTLDFGRKERDEKRDKETKDRQKKARDDFFKKKRIPRDIEYLSTFTTVDEYIDRVVQCTKESGEKGILYLALGLVYAFNDLNRVIYNLKLYYCINVNGSIKFVANLNQDDQKVIEVEAFKLFMTEEYVEIIRVELKHILDSKNALRVKYLLEINSNDLVIKFTKREKSPKEIKCIESIFPEIENFNIEEIRYIPTEKLFSEWVDKVVICSLENSQEYKYYLAFGLIVAQFFNAFYSIKIEGKIYFQRLANTSDEPLMTPTMFKNNFDTKTYYPPYWLPAIEAKKILQNPKYKPNRFNEWFFNLSFDPIDVLPNQLSCVESLDQNPDESLSIKSLDEI